MCMTPVCKISNLGRPFKGLKKYHFFLPFLFVPRSLQELLAVQITGLISQGGYKPGMGSSTLPRLHQEKIAPAKNDGGLS